MLAEDQIPLSVCGLSVSFDNKAILENLDLTLYPKEILGVIGPSGCGKSILMRAILGLKEKTAGVIKILGEELKTTYDKDLAKRMGVLFQQGALFSGLTALENIQEPMRQLPLLSARLKHELARLKLDMVGLPYEAGDKYLSELSGGMIKRVALARAIALDPAIVFLDEPTAGLDPISARQFNELIVKLRHTIGLSVYLITHDVESLYAICDRVAVLGNKRIKMQGTIEELKKSEDPWVKDYFNSAAHQQNSFAERG